MIWKFTALKKDWQRISTELAKMGVRYSFKKRPNMHQTIALLVEPPENLKDNEAEETRKKIVGLIRYERECLDVKR